MCPCQPQYLSLTHPAKNQSCKNGIQVIDALQAKVGKFADAAELRPVFWLRAQTPRILPADVSLRQVRDSYYFPFVEIYAHP